jgi:hypothetical protein
MKVKIIIVNFLKKDAFYYLSWVQTNVIKLNMMINSIKIP